VFVMVVWGVSDWLTARRGATRRCGSRSPRPW